MSGHASGLLRVCSPTKAKRLHHQRECRRGLAAARVVEVIPRTRRTPIRENAYEPTLFHKSFHPIFRKIRKPKALKCRILHQGQRVEDGPTLDADFKLATALPEFPGVEASMGGQTQIDAAWSVSSCGVRGGRRP